jgi:hypothetical protein
MIKRDIASKLQSEKGTYMILIGPLAFKNLLANTLTRINTMFVRGTFIKDLFYY